ncbi:sensor histidine kinase [Nocardia crassostreae]|uniref:sensor histidine kinase n=1 Tax=Nocardia crassostreae TaxID=53428 RepID=UPI00082E9AC1|nr:sensor histidine kinase [Nocardia crassostreae]
MTETRSRRNLEPVVRCLPLVLVPLLLAVSTFPGEYGVPGMYWLLAMTAALLFAVGGRWPLPLSLALSALAVPMFRIPAWGLSGLVPLIGALALVDVVRRTQRTPPLILATVCWGVAVLLGRWNSHTTSVTQAAIALEVGTYVALPVLLGLYLRGQARLADSLRLRAAEAETRRAEAEQRTRLVERGALARELHDLVAHHMASIVLRIGVARHVVAEADPRVRAVLDDVHDTASDALADIRRLLAALRDPELGEVALMDAAAVRTELEAAIDRVRAAGFTVEADTRSRIAGLDAIGRLTLLRLIQESLTNVMKHADPAAPVVLTVRDAEGGIAVGVRSGGTRSDSNPTAASGSNPTAGHGIIGMRERAELAGGRLTVGGDGASWVIDAWLPASATPDIAGTPEPDPAADFDSAAELNGAADLDPAPEADSPRDVNGTLDLGAAPDREAAPEIDARPHVGPAPEAPALGGQRSTRSER